MDGNYDDDQYVIGNNDDDDYDNKGGVPIIKMEI